MRKSSLILLLCLVSSILNAQLIINGIVNQYLAVDSVVNGGDAVFLPSTDGLSNFSAEDKVLLIQMTGYTLANPPDWQLNPGNRGLPNSVGKYEFLVIESIDAGQQKITFTANFINSYKNGEKFQLVKIIESEYATVSGGELKAKEWDGTTGGIVALVVYKKLTLNSGINVSSQGFLGANPLADYTGGCRIQPGGLDTMYFRFDQLNRAGIKGEGIINADFDHPYGAGRNHNGGGGGNGLYAGGGGGSNFGVGGYGGIQSCSELLQASGGFNYTETNFYKVAAGSNSVIMGGGGGSSTENSGLSRLGNKGGDGGGIVFIITDTLVSASSSIKADGQNVTGTATAGGSGGGGGGSIILDVNTYIGSLSLSAKGGNGGATGPDCAGSGGGGGGGVILYTGTTAPPATITLSGGTVGAVGSGCGLYTGSSGNAGGSGDSATIVLNGFLFNIIEGIDTVCEGLSPNTVSGSIPKGGNGSFSYQWQKRGISESSWTNVGTLQDSLYYSPGPLNETTYFRRYVTGTVVSVLQTDTSKTVEIFVYPKIANNELYVTDTICMLETPGLLTGGAVSGGGGAGSYEYTWERSTNQMAWMQVSASDSYTEGNLSINQYYRRIVTSTIYCTDTSEIDTITVLSFISNNNFITFDTTICYNLDAGTLSPENVSGGDGTYSYQWLSRSNSGAWSSIASTDVAAYSPGILTDSTHYRRIVFSGNDNACIDTSGTKSVFVLPAISGNTLISDSTLYCYQDTPGIITGEPGLAGGDGSFEYIWFKKQSYGDFEIISGAIGFDYSPIGAYTDTTTFRRRVISGDYDACIDESNELVIKVIPEITNTLLSTEQSICENSIPQPLTENEPSGGAGPGSYSYEWQYRETGSALWQSASGTNFQQSYSPGPLTDSTYYRRQVSSEICSKTSNPVLIEVFPSIQNNLVLGGSLQYTCFNTSRALSGTTPAGGQPGDNPRYLWEKSLDGNTWQDGAGANNQRDFTTDVLNENSLYRRIVFSGTNDECIDTSSTVEVMMNPLPVADLVSQIDTVCAGESYPVEYNVSGNGPWEIFIGNGIDSKIESVNEGNGNLPIVLTVTGEVVLLSVVDDSLCAADLSMSSGKVEITAFEVPQANAGIDSASCGLDYTLQAIASVGQGIWSADFGNFENETLPSTKVSVNNYGSHTFTWTEKNWECEDSDELEVVFYEQPDTSDAGNSQVLHYNFSTQLNALPADVGSGVWSFILGDGEFEDSTNAYTTVNFSGIGNYILQWTITNGVCPSVYDTIYITLNDLVIEKGFSPNGDNVNDLFIIDVTGSGNAELTIFNRWGNIIYHSANYTPENYWDGKNQKGNEVPEDTYFYILKEQNNRVRQGFVELRR